MRPEHGIVWDVKTGDTDDVTKDGSNEDDQIKKVDSIAYEGGVTSLFELNDEYMLCNDWQSRSETYDYANGEFIGHGAQMPLAFPTGNLADRSVVREKFLPRYAVVPVDEKAYGLAADEVGDAQVDGEAFDPDKVPYDGGYRVQYVASGLAPGATAISYAFPTGDVVDATINDQMWNVAYELPAPVASRDDIGAPPTQLSVDHHGRWFDHAIRVHR